MAGPIFMTILVVLWMILDLDSQLDQVDPTPGGVQTVVL